MDSALVHAVKLDTAPLTVAVLDAGGHLVAFKRQDKSGILRGDIAIGKAWGALGLGTSTRFFAPVAEHMPQLVSSLSTLAGGRVVPTAGGVLIRDKDDRLMGAIGISGDRPEIDEQCAILGIESAGLIPDLKPPHMSSPDQ